MVWPFSKSVDPDELNRWLNSIYQLIRRTKGDIMASLDDLRNVIAEVEAAAAAERSQVAEGLAKISEQAARIAELVAAGSPDVGPEVARLQAVVDGLKADDPAPEAPPAG